MADVKDKKQDKANASSEGFGFKSQALGFDKNEVNLYINKLKKQMSEQQQEYEERINNMRKNLEDAHDESNAAKAAAREAAGAAPAASAQITDFEIKQMVDAARKESEDQIMKLRKQVLDERRNVAKFDKDCAMAQMSEKKVREEYAKLKEKYNAVKKAGGGGKAVVTSNADEVLDEACRMAQQIFDSANAYAKASVESVNAYKAKVEAELKARGEKLAAAKKQLDEQSAKAEADNAAAKKSIKEIADKISAVTGQLGSFAASFDSVNQQISAVTGQIDSVTGQFGTVTKQINEATEAIGGVTKQFGTVSQQINAAAQSIDGVTKQFTDVSGKLTAAKNSFGSVSDTLAKAKTSFGSVTKSVSDTKESISGIKTGADGAAKLTDSIKTGAVDSTALASVGAVIQAASAGITAELVLPEFKPAFDKAKLDELKKKLKVETTYEGGSVFDDDDDDSDILSTIEIDDIPDSPMPTDDELMADMADTMPVPEAEPAAEAKPAPAAAPVKEEKAAPAPKQEGKKAKKQPVDDDLSDFLITPATDGGGLINSQSVDPLDDFTLDNEPEPAGDDFFITPNDLAASPDKGEDLGEDIFDMATGASEDFELTPAELNSDYKVGAGAMDDDFGEFADLFAAGSAQTTAKAEKKKPAAFRQPSNSDDPFNFGTEGSGDDDDLSADSDFADFLL